MLADERRDNERDTKKIKTLVTIRYPTLTISRLKEQKFRREM